MALSGFLSCTFISDWLDRYPDATTALSPKAREEVRLKLEESEEFAKLVKTKPLSPPHNTLSLAKLKVNLTNHFYHSCVYNSQKETGRYVKATEDISPGTKILHENAFTKVLGKNWRTKRCERCLHNLSPNIQFSCGVCKIPIYCSEMCERAGWNEEGHSYLCGMTELLELLSDDEILCLKILLKLIFQENSSARNEVQLGYSLESNLKAHQPRTILSYIANSILFANILDLPTTTEQDILDIHGQVRCNAFAIKHTLFTTISSSPVMQEEDLSLGIAIYTSASMLNHSCKANALVMFSEDGQIMVTVIEDVKEGEEIYITYGPHVRMTSKIERIEKLQQNFLFQCECNLCSSSEDGLVKFYRCPAPTPCPNITLAATDMACPKCGKHFHLSKFEKLESECQRLMQSENLNSLLKCLALQRSIYCPTAYVLGRTYDKISYAYASVGQFKESSVYCRKSIAILTFHLGERSPEVAREYLKLCTLLSHTAEPDALKIMERTLRLYKELGWDNQNLVVELRRIQEVFLSHE